MSIRERFEALRCAPSPTAADLDALWADHAVAHAEEMLGTSDPSYFRLEREQG